MSTYNLNAYVSRPEFEDKNERRKYECEGNDRETERLYQGGAVVTASPEHKARR